MPTTVGAPPLRNPAGQAVSPIVGQVMARYGLETGAAEFRRQGLWSYASERSAVVALETSQRCRVQLELTAGEGGVEGDGGLHYIHIFQLLDLEPDTPYQWRAVAVDRAGRSTSQSGTLCTRSRPQAIRIPADIPGPPFVLRQAGYYLLTAPLVAPGTALVIAADGVTLDLGGQQVVYDEGPGPRGADSGSPVCGVRIEGHRSDIRLVNGSLVQGRAQSGGGEDAVGANPLLVEDMSRSEIAGLRCGYGGAQLSGLYCRRTGAGVRLHHNRIEDRGKQIDNRHKMCVALRLASAGGGIVYNNLVARARQSGIARVGLRSQVWGNEVHIDSYSINSFGIDVKDGCRVRANKVFGHGDNVVGLVTTGGCKGIELCGNYVWLQAHDLAAYRSHLNSREMESSPVSVMSGMRITWGAEDVVYRDNAILVSGRDGGWIRGTFLYNDAAVRRVVCRGNLIAALAEDEQTQSWGAVAGVGSDSRGPTEPILFIDNTIVSNFANFNLQDPYGASVDYRFVGNEFVKVGQRPDYATVRGRSGRPSRGHCLLDNRFVDGAGHERADIGAEDEFAVAWTARLQGEAGAAVRIVDAAGREVFAGYLDAGGELALPLVYCQRRGPATSVQAPYVAEIVGAQETVTLRLDYPGTAGAQIED